MEHHSDSKVFPGRVETECDVLVLIDILTEQPSLMPSAFQKDAKFSLQNHVFIQRDLPHCEPDKEKWQYQKKSGCFEVYQGLVPEGSRAPTLKVVKMEGFVIKIYEHIRVWENEDDDEDEDKGAGKTPIQKKDYLDIYKSPRAVLSLRSMSQLYDCFTELLRRPGRTKNFVLKELSFMSELMSGMLFLIKQEMDRSTQPAVKHFIAVHGRQAQLHKIQAELKTDKEWTELDQRLIDMRDQTYIEMLDNLKELRDKQAA